MSSKITGHWPKPHTFTGTRLPHRFPDSVIDMLCESQWGNSKAVALLRALYGAIHMRSDSLFSHKSRQVVARDIAIMRAKLREALYG